MSRGVFVHIVEERVTFNGKCNLVLYLEGRVIEKGRKRKRERI